MHIDKRASFGISPFIALALSLTQVTPAEAQTLEGVFSGVDFSVNGFGTAGTVFTNSNSAQFIRGDELTGASKTPSEAVDSNIAVQGTARFNSWLSATVQVYDGKNALIDPVAWAYLKIDPLANLSIKVGKVEMPIFMISDSLNIGYANTWVRPPNEVYGLSISEEMKGAEATYTLPIGSTHLSATVYGGNGLSHLGGLGGGNVWDIHGVEARWETDWITFRGGYMTQENELAPGSHDKYTFSGVGAMMDHSNFVGQVEWVERKSAGFPSVVNADGWYVLGGYRVGTIVPYASYAETTKSKPYMVAFSGDQTTKAVGVRWDAFKSADIKFQLERIDPKGTQGVSFANETPHFGNSEVTAATVLVDFVF